MPQQLQKTTRNSFNKGLLTEFTPLAFPNEASIDELNCTLKKAGNRTKRLGIEYEFPNSLTDETYAEDTLFSTGSWKNVGGDPEVEFLVVQTGRYLRFFKKTSGSLSSEVVDTTFTSGTPYILDMLPFQYVGGLGAKASAVDVASIDGYLVVASPQIDTFYISRNLETGAFTTTQIEFRIRDFEWLSDRDTLSSPLALGSTGSNRRKYDSYNAGWAAENVDATVFFVPSTSPTAQTLLDLYTTAENAFPPLSHPWFSGKNSSGNFDLGEFKRVYAGNSLTANGHYILDLFNQDRSAASGISPIVYSSKNVPTGRFNTVAAYAGRIFYSGVDGRVYFSQLLEDVSQIGELLQSNDPTAEYSNDLLDTDGGYIRLPDATNIRKLHQFGDALLVFAENGVWRISGTDGVFRPTEFSVYRVTNEGIATRRSFASGANGQPFWWSYNGIHSVQVTEEGGMVEVNLTEDTIKTFWRALDSNAKENVVAIYDQYERTVMWLYPDNGETIAPKKNNLLLLNTDLGAFYPWKVSDQAENTNYIVGMSYYKGAVSEEVTYDVIDENEDFVVDVSGNQVQATFELGHVGSSRVKFLVRDGLTGSLTFAEFTSTSFTDWGTEDYEAYAESAYNFMGDLTRKKNSPYITVFLKRTEEGWQDNADGSSSIIRPSSCKVEGYWDFRNIPSSSKQEAYKYKYLLVPGDTFSYPHDVIATRLKLRGRGRVLRLRFEGTAGHDFDLLGWETIDAVNPRF